MSDNAGEEKKVGKPQPQPQPLSQMCQLKKRKIALTEEDVKKVDTILAATENRVLVDEFNIEMTTQLIKCLSPGWWLNDEVMNFYVAMLNARMAQTDQRCHLFNSFFYTLMLHGGGYNYIKVRRWSKRAGIKIIEQRKVLAPIHVGNNHWCLAVIDFKQKKFLYYDSLGGDGKQCLNNLRRYVQDEAKQYHHIENYDLSEWKNDCPKNIPRQHNGCDCGVFTLKYADYVSEDCPLIFTQGDMPYFRRRMVIQIMETFVL